MRSSWPGTSCFLPSPPSWYWVERRVLILRFWSGRDSKIETVSAIYLVGAVLSWKNSTKLNPSDDCGALPPALEDVGEDGMLAMGRGKSTDFFGGTGRGRVDSLAKIPRPTGVLSLSGLGERRPAETMAAFSSSCVGSLIGDGTRGDCCCGNGFEARSHNEETLFTGLEYGKVAALVLGLSLEGDSRYTIR
jgi:hypothetical protein